MQMPCKSMGNLLLTHICNENHLPYLRGLNMKQSNIMIAVMILGLILACFGNAQAQLMLEQGAVDAMSARMSMQSLARNVPSTTVIERLKLQGYKEIAEVPHAANTFTAISPVGLPVNLTIEPHTGQVVSMTPR